MLYYLSQELSAQFSALNVFRYITFRTGAALMTSALIVFLFGPAIIASLKSRQGKGQPIRDDGPETHFAKAGTPTMGGLIILSGVLVSSLLWGNLSNVYVWVVLTVTIGFGAIGFYDDYLKVSGASHKGFSGKARLGLEAIIAGFACYVVMRSGAAPFSSSLTFPFFKDLLLNLGIFFIPFGALVIVGAGNAVNLTDGLDGLAIVPVMIAAASFGAIAYLSGNAIFSGYLQIHFRTGYGRGGRFVRCDHWRGPWVFVVQRTSCRNFHGRHRFACLGWHDRRDGGCNQARDCPGNNWRSVCNGSVVGDNPGRVFQAHGKTGFPYGSHPPPL